MGPDQSEVIPLERSLGHRYFWAPGGRTRMSHSRPQTLQEQAADHLDDQEEEAYHQPLHPGRRHPRPMFCPSQRNHLRLVFVEFGNITNVRGHHGLRILHITQAKGLSMSRRKMIMPQLIIHLRDPLTIDRSHLANPMTRKDMGQRGALSIKTFYARAEDTKR